MLILAVAGGLKNRILLCHDCTRHFRCGATVANETIRFEAGFTGGAEKSEFAILTLKEGVAGIKSELTPPGCKQPRPL